MGQRRVGLPVVSPGSESVSNTSFDHLRHRGRLPLKRRAVPGLLPQMAGMIDVLGVRQEIGVGGVGVAWAHASDNTLQAPDFTSCSARR